MLKDLIKLANELDSKGLVKQADLLDRAINKRALWDDHYGQPEDYRANTAEMMMEDFNKRLSHDEQDKFVQMFARVIDGWEEFKKKRLEKEREAYREFEKEFEIDNLNNYHGKDKHNLIALYWGLPNEDKKTALLLYERIARISRDEEDYSLHPDTMYKEWKKPSDDSGVGTRILKDLINQKGATKRELYAAYQEGYRDGVLRHQEQVDKLNNPDKLSSMSNEEFINAFDSLDAADNDAEWEENNINYYRELVKRHKAGGIKEPDSQNEMVVNPEDVDSEDIERYSRYGGTYREEAYIIVRLMDGLGKEKLQAIYNQT